MLLCARRVEGAAAGDRIVLLLDRGRHRSAAERAGAAGLVELRYRRLFETARDGIVLMDAESGRITTSTPRWAR